MPIQRPWRKLAAVAALLVLIFVYSLLIMVFATSTLPSVGGAVSFLFYAVAGMGWVPFAILILKWGYKP
ncbi:MAG TPA: DUF2842 domain-containing protein [Hyphomicrobiaceae bacterium]|nr:DUF2842 domain-containing protein [Hyphomicrobiaceae bacterium]